MSQYEIKTPDEATMKAAQQALGVWREPDPEIPGDQGGFGTGGLLRNTGLTWAAMIYGTKVVDGVAIEGYFGIMSWPDEAELPELPTGVTIIPLPDDSPFRFA